jgi:hypothetical protein
MHLFARRAISHKLALTSLSLKPHSARFDHELRCMRPQLTRNLVCNTMLDISFADIVAYNS